MKQYQDLGNGRFQIGGSDFPDDMTNRERRRMQVEIDAGQAEILPYVAPAAPAPSLTLAEEVAAMREAIEATGSASLKASLETKRAEKLAAKG